MRLTVFLLILAFVFPTLTFSHGGKQHGDKTPKPSSTSEKKKEGKQPHTPIVGEDGFEIISQEPSKEQLQEVHQLYTKNVQSIFQQKCFNCHGTVDSLPWYARIPGPKQLIRKDIREAKEHMDMSEGFPFQGHGAPIDDLEAIERTLQENSMPPLRYKIMHWRSGVTSKEKAVIQEWMTTSREILQPKKGKNK